MNAHVKIGGDRKIVCTLLKNAEGKDINQVVDNVYALKWSFGVGDKYPIGAISYLVAADKQAHAQIPAANMDLDFGNGWKFHADVDNELYRLTFHNTVVKGVQYLEVDASRTIVDGQPKTKIVLSFVTPILPPQFADVQFQGGMPIFSIGGTNLGYLQRGTISCDAKKTPTCEATLVIESED